MAGVTLPLAPQRSTGQTSRPDRWWVQPAVVFTGLAMFVVYSTWAAFQGDFYAFGPYLSPMYSPVLWGDSPHAWFGKIPSWFPSWAPWLYSPAFLDLKWMRRPVFRLHVLLLPRRLLQSVLGRSVQLRGRRTAQRLHRREQLAVEDHEHSPLLFLSRRAVHLDADTTMRCSRFVLVPQ